MFKELRVLVCSAFNLDSENEIKYLRPNGGVCGETTCATDTLVNMWRGESRNHGFRNAMASVFAVGLLLNDAWFP